MSERFTLQLAIEDDDDLTAAKAAAWDVPGLDVQAVGEPDSGGFDNQFEPVTAVLVAGAAVLVAKFVTDWWERRKGGLVLDQRPGKPEIRRDKALPWGYVVIYPTDGAVVRIETRDAPKDALQQLLESIVGGVLGNSDDITAAAVKALGEGALPPPSGTP